MEVLRVLVYFLWKSRVQECVEEPLVGRATSGATNVLLSRGNLSGSSRALYNVRRVRDGSGVLGDWVCTRRYVAALADLAPSNLEDHVTLMGSGRTGQDRTCRCIVCMCITSVTNIFLSNTPSL